MQLYIIWEEEGMVYCMNEWNDEMKMVITRRIRPRLPSFAPMRNQNLPILVRTHRSRAAFSSCWILPSWLASSRPLLPLAGYHRRPGCSAGSSACWGWDELGWLGPSLKKGCFSRATFCASRGRSGPKAPAWLAPGFLPSWNDPWFPSLPSVSLRVFRF